MSELVPLRVIPRNKMETNHLDTNQIMRQVIYALVLGVGVQIYFFGSSVIVQIILAIITAIIAEEIGRASCRERV